jgi:preprotein translocase subunit SecG
MTGIFIVLVIIAAVVLGFLVLIQAPKGGGLATNVGGVGSNLMGVKETTDVLEKGTWIFVTILALLCLFSSALIGGKAKTVTPKAVPQQQEQKK